MGMTITQRELTDATDEAPVVALTAADVVVAGRGRLLYRDALPIVQTRVAAISVHRAEGRHCAKKRYIFIFFVISKQW